MVKLYIFYNGEIVAMEAEERKSTYKLKERSKAFAYRTIIAKNNHQYARNTLEINNVSTCPKGALTLALRHQEGIKRAGQFKVDSAAQEIITIKTLLAGGKNGKR